MSLSASTDWISQAQALQPELVASRRDLHQHPELAFEEVRTAGIVAQTLTRLGLEVTTGVGKTGVVAVLEGAHDGPTVLVRCDMDALPIREENTVDYISTVPGKMHACGHDGHVTIGLGVAQLLSAQREYISGRVKFLFQPAEEVANGAQAMINDGALQNPTPDVGFGLHLWNELPFGEVAITTGPFMAGADLFKITITGSGGHAAIPDQTRDPVVAGAQIVNALQTIVSRNVSPLDTAVVSVTMFHAGTANNAIANTAELQGTFRTYRPATHDLVERRLREIVTGVATALGCEAAIETQQVAPPLINNADTSERLRQAFAPLADRLSLKLRDDVRTMTAEDMAVILNHVPGTYFFVGSANADHEPTYPHHHARFNIEERALPVGVALLCTAVAGYVLPGA
ncbi:MAG: M20 metallopeptidase family protein [Aggregatilineales bacterium]